MKRYEDIGNFWSERQAGNTEAEVELREAQQTLKAARRQENMKKDTERRRLAALKGTNNEVVTS